MEDGLAKEPLPANFHRIFFERIKNPGPDDWPAYNGNLNGNSYIEVKQIELTNVGKLAVKWLFAIDHFGLEMTPLAGDATWLTGAYDPSTDTLFRPTGNPWPDSDDHCIIGMRRSRLCWWIRCVGARAGRAELRNAGWRSL